MSANFCHYFFSWSFFGRCLIFEINRHFRRMKEFNNSSVNKRERERDSSNQPNKHEFDCSKWTQTTNNNNNESKHRMKKDIKGEQQKKCCYHHHHHHQQHSICFLLYHILHHSLSEKDLYHFFSLSLSDFIWAILGSLFFHSFKQTNKQTSNENNETKQTKQTSYKWW